MAIVPKGLRSKRGVFFLALFWIALTPLLVNPRTAEAQTQGKRKVPLTISGDFKIWLPVFDGTMRAGTEENPGSQNRLDRHLDLEEHPEVYEFGLGLGDIRYGKLTASFLRFTAPGNKVLTRDVDFAGVSFLAPETVHTDFSVDLDRVSVSYIQDVRGAYILTYEVGMAYFRWKTRIANRHTGISASEDSSSTLPLTGLHAIFPLGNALQLQFGFSGVFFRTSSDDVNTMETYGEIQLTLAKYLTIGFGYKHFHLDAELDLKGSKIGELEFTLNGVYFIFGLKF